ncbi:uncharacterized protein LOC116010220 [Ipomoea triloba]|uniref:uncharacterized protein LOC116010220 n=1 Tax=Ipomoea triloba TaxID=35885 RepID=UPI00125DC76B|nr:uncharacterized protein LOC116010220 [Ipomoea triloba]
MHLRQNGIDTDYTQWIFHGESPTFQEQSNNGSQVEYDDSDDDENLDGVDEFLNEYGNFVNFNSQLNPNTHSGEIDHFENMLREAKQELYPGCTKFSKLSLTVKLLHLKVYNKWSNKSFDMLLELLKECLPDGNTLPHSHYESKSMLCNLGLGYTNIHACKYDCVLFWKELETNECCPICGTSRWKVKGSKGKNIPHKILRYFPLKPRLQRLFMSKKIANDMRWHKERRIDDDEYLRHPADFKAWKDFDKEFPWFANDARNVRLGLASDGFNPFGNMSNAYSMWPVILIPYNLPPWMCMKESFFMLTLLIPRPKAPGRDIDVYLQPLIDDLIELWEGGVTTYDSYSSTNFQLHASILWTINDFPTYGNLSRWSTKGYMRADGSYEVPHPCYMLTRNERLKFAEFLESVKFPDGYASNISRCVTTDGKLIGLKSHDCHVLLQRILPIGVRGILGKEVATVLYELGDFFRQLCCKTLKLTDLEAMRDNIVIILCKLEMIYPPAFFDVMVYLAIHLPQEAILGGPVQFRWMFMIERFLGSLKHYVRNKARPEGSIAEGYVASECLTFLSLYLDGIETRFNKPYRNNDGEAIPSELSIFSHNVRPCGAWKYEKLSREELDNIQWFALSNCDEVGRYMKEHIDLLEKESLLNVNQRHKKEFPFWFREKVSQLYIESATKATDALYSLACGPQVCSRKYTACIVNGVRFHTKDRDSRHKTQNSGIVVQGNHGDELIDFYGVLNEVIELEYIKDHRIVLFKCDWFDIGKRSYIQHDVVEAERKGDDFRISDDEDETLIEYNSTDEDMSDDSYESEDDLDESEDS